MGMKRQGQTAQTHPTTQSGSRTARTAPDPRHGHRDRSSPETFGKLPQDQRVLWAQSPPFPTLHFILNGHAWAWLPFPRLGNAVCWETLKEILQMRGGGQKALLSGFYYQVLLSQHPHAAESLRNRCSQPDQKSSLRTQDRQRDLHRTSLYRAKLRREWDGCLKWSDARCSAVKRKDAKWLIYNIISSWLADVINICACVICFCSSLQLCPFSMP